MSLPSGTVTFLMTDIEGSTRLWEEHPEDMRLDLERHDQIVHAVVREFAGVLVKGRGEGDSHFAVFPLATNAVAAAGALQSSFSRQPWQRTIRVRMALHTGEADIRGGDYYGPAVNRCARLRAIAHGDQVLLSGATLGLCRDFLPATCYVKPLGEHRLKDLGRPETVFQLCQEGVQSDFPPVRSLDNPDLPHNLPQQVTSFVGRERELAEVVALFHRARLVTLVGSGGCGKTRLALQVAADMLEGLADGAWLVELAALSDTALVPQAVASVLGVKEEIGKSLTQTLAERLRKKRLLIVLDNCEHLLDGCMELADTVIRACPQLLIMATSRERLGISGELIYRVPSLGLPDLAGDITPEAVSGFEAVRLFVERAQFHQAQFAITPQNASAITAICHRLDGIPLALELAASRVPVLRPEQLVVRLDDRFRLLTGGSRRSLPRHQTLRAMMDWSYELLSEQEKALLQRLAVFAGGWNLAAAETICSDSQEDEPNTSLKDRSAEPASSARIASSEILDLLTGLVTKSLVQVSDDNDSEARYRLLETVRQYALERLGGGEEYRRLILKHRKWFLPLAVAADEGIRGAEQKRWIERVEQDFENLRAAMDWCAGDHEAEMQGLRIAASLWRFSVQRGNLRECYDRLTSFLSFRQRNDTTTIVGDALNGAGVVAFQLGKWEEARSYFTEALAVRRAAGDQSGAAMSMSNLGNIASDHDGDFETAGRWYRDSLDLLTALGDKWGMAMLQNNLGNALRRLGHYDDALRYFGESLEICHSTGDNILTCWALSNVALVKAALNDHVAARTALKDSLAFRWELRDRMGLSESLDILVSIAAAEARQGKPVDLRLAATLYGAAATLRAEIGSTLPSTDIAERGKDVETIRQLLGESDFESACESGRALSLTQVLRQALDACSE